MNILSDALATLEKWQKTPSWVETLWLKTTGLRNRELTDKCLMQNCYGCNEPKCCRWFFSFATRFDSIELCLKSCELTLTNEALM